jgi:hypothetical protein
MKNGHHAGQWQAIPDDLQDVNIRETSWRAWFRHVLLLQRFSVFSPTIVGILSSSAKRAAVQAGYFI